LKPPAGGFWLFRLILPWVYLLRCVRSPLAKLHPWLFMVQPLRGFFENLIKSWRDLTINSPVRSAGLFNEAFQGTRQLAGSTYQEYFKCDCPAHIRDKISVSFNIIILISDIIQMINYIIKHISDKISVINDIIKFINDRISISNNIIKYRYKVTSYSYNNLHYSY
jgi:hypothetical protein